MGNEEIRNNVNLNASLYANGVNGTDGMSSNPIGLNLDLSGLCLFDPNMALMIPADLDLGTLFSFTPPLAPDFSQLGNIDLSSGMSGYMPMFPTVDLSSYCNMFAGLDNSNMDFCTGNPIARTDGDFDKMLNFVLRLEGGGDRATRVAGDRGGLTKKGIIQKTYDSYRKGKGLPTQSVGKMTDAEMKDIYYNMFYKASGADKISDARLAMHVFDTAVNMGVSTAKSLLSQSGGDLNRFIQLRKSKYNSICANNPSQNKFKRGWDNRMSRVQNYAQNYLA